MAKKLIIQRFILTAERSQTVHMPRGAYLLAVYVSHGSPTIEAAVDVTEPFEEIPVSLFVAGDQVTEKPGIYVGHFQWPGQGTVYHVFARGVAPV